MIRRGTEPIRDLVTVSIDRADPCTVEILKPRRRFDPIDGRPNVVRSGGRATPGTVGILTASATTAVPRAIDGTRLGGGAVPIMTHSSSATKIARNPGVALCGLRGSARRPGLGSVPGRPPCWVPAVTKPAP